MHEETSQETGQDTDQVLDRLPASLAAAWGLRARPGKGPKPGLTLERIVAAGVKIAETEGLGAVSMGRVATELGAATMSLYRYVTAKGELLDLMVDAAAGQPPAAEPGEDWRSGLHRFAHAHLALLRRHPWVMRVAIGGPPVTPNQIAWMDRGLSILRGTGLREYEKLSTILTLIGLVRHWAQITADMSAAAQAAGETSDEAMLGYGQLLTRLVDPRRFPAVGDLIASGILDLPAGDPDEDFEFGLERLMDGIAVLIRRRDEGGECADEAQPDPTVTR
ncbi:TetR/AcrR family transcriptional regulator [Dactylosporangium fulvum]|uniref:TetR/AcrR family transcriptional regulator n=1 Tax=Dactylosporangium fulvum TaxID=53359 RepID=A0ABY5W2U9_9ACTN|nr:TetR/AcrR family transcriptional regulator [Dactylosporangium fulvum]UWP84333.1 TetR/AcrR family transcriptional regulator [Dactylosporangium fulvum]